MFTFIKSNKITDTGEAEDVMGPREGDELTGTRETNYVTSTQSG